MEFDTVTCGDYIRGLVLSPPGKAIRRILCPVSVSADPAVSPSNDMSNDKKKKNDTNNNDDDDDDAPPLMDLVVKEVPFAATNRVFTVVNQLGNGGSIIVKCFLSYYRTKPSVSLPLPCTARARTEYLWNQIMVAINPNKVPTILYFDEDQGILVYERLETHVTTRLELTMGNRYPLIAEDMSIVFSRACWFTTIRTDSSITTDKTITTGPTIISTTPESMKTILSSIQPNIQRLRNNFTTFTDPQNTVPSLLYRQLFPLLQESTPFTNTHTKSTILDRWETALRNDTVLMQKVQQLATHFQSSSLSSSSSSLIHGDLHTGNILTAILRTKPVDSDYHAMRDEQAKFEKMTPEELEAMLIAQAQSTTPTAVGDLRIIDSEYSGFGPVGYDIGTFMAHLIIALESGRSKVRAQEALIARGGYAKYTAEKTKERWATHCSEIATTIVNLWLYFVSHYIALWNENQGIVIPPSQPHHHDHNCDHDHDHASNVGSSSSSSSSLDDGGIWKEQLTYLRSILENAVHYIGIEIIRRVFGALHVHDLESIESPIARAATEVRLVSFGRYCIVNGTAFSHQILQLSSQQTNRDNGIQYFSNAFETLISGIAAMDGENGWSIIDKATPNTVITDDVLYPGRTLNRTIVIVDNSSSTVTNDSKVQTLQQFSVPAGYRKVVLSADSTLNAPSWETVIITVPVSTVLSSFVRSVWGPIVFMNMDSTLTLTNDVDKCDEGEMVIADDNKFVAIPPHLVLLKLEGMDNGTAVTVPNMVEKLISNYR